MRRSLVRRLRRFFRRRRGERVSLREQRQLAFQSRQLLRQFEDHLVLLRDMMLQEGDLLLEALNVRVHEPEPELDWRNFSSSGITTRV